MFNKKTDFSAHLRPWSTGCTLLIAAWLGHALPAMAEAPSRPLVVFAAASLAPVLGSLENDWAAGGKPPSISYAGTATLARQLRAGAPVDVFIAADRIWLDALTAEGRLLQPRRVAGNQLVLIASRDIPLSTLQLSPRALGAVLGKRGRLALAQTDSVPAGRYARAGLTSLGLWPEVERRLAEAADVRAALRLVALGEAPLGVVYATDARSEPRVRVVAEFPPGSHPPIEYWAAAVAGHRHPDTEAYLRFLASPAAMAHFRQAGFTNLSPHGSP